MFRARILAAVAALVFTVGTAQAGPCTESIQRVEKSMESASPAKQAAAQKYIDQAKAAAQAGKASQCQAAVKHAKGALATKNKKHRKHKNPPR